jgi:hypothetical protein
VSYPERGGSSLADPHRIGPFGGWHFGSMAGRTLRGVAPSPETLRSRAPSNGGKRGWAGWANGDWRSGCLRTRVFTYPATRSAARSRTATPPRQKGTPKSVGRKESGAGAASARDQLSFEGLLSRDGRAPSRSSKSFSRRSSGEGRSRKRVRARGLPSQDSFFGKKGRSFRLPSGSAGSTRLVKHGVQCSRGSRDDRSGRASPSRVPFIGSDALISPPGNSRRISAATAARLHRRAPAISFVARRGRHPEVLIG